MFPEGEVFVNDIDFTSEVKSFADSIGFNRIASGRYSKLIAMQLFIGASCRVIDAFRVMREIEGLEYATGRSITKPSTQFYRAPLKGLWHKHFLPSGMSSFARNLINEMKTDEFSEVLNKIFDQNTGQEMTDEIAGRFAHEAVLGNYDRRSSRKSMTGEWIVYAEYDGEKYYLCIGTHKEGDERIAREIRDVCFVEFPFLEDLMLSSL